MPTLASLASVNAALLNVRDVATRAARTFVQSRQDRTLAQTRINDLASSVSRIADASNPRDVARLSQPADGAFSVVNVSPSVAKWHLYQTTFPGQSYDVNVDITRSAQVGALLLSFGGGIIDLSGVFAASAGAKFAIEIQGARGAQELSFTSGTSLANVRDAINTFINNTGVRASVVGQSGIRLETTGFGSDEFVRIRVLQHSGALGAGVLRYSATNSNIPDTGSSTPFGVALNPVVDFGQDLAVSINGRTAIGRGAEVAAIPSIHQFGGEFRLTTQRAQSLGSFLAFQVVGLSDSAPLPAGDQGLPADQPRLYNNSGVISPRITSKSVDLRG